MTGSPDLTIRSLGEGHIASPFPAGKFVDDSCRVLHDSTVAAVTEAVRVGNEPLSFECGGPRRRIFFDPKGLRCGIVTCGGLCPGINDVIRSIVLGLYSDYGVTSVFGFRYGYEGLVARLGHEPAPLTPERVGSIHHLGGTILSSSRGPQDVGEMVDTLESLGIGILFCIGGDGTLRGAHAIAEETMRRGKHIAVVGVPKTIDNDICFIQQSFGFETAITESRTSTYAAHTEATGAKNGVGLVKLMGRHSGFIAAYAALANNEVDFCLIPEVRFTLDGFLSSLRARIDEAGHAVVVVAEGAGQDILDADHGCDASGNVRLGDIGLFLRDHIKHLVESDGLEGTVKYIDPSYTIRSVPANAHDSALCLLLGQNAVHAGMAGKTDVVVGSWRGEWTHVPIMQAVSARKHVDPEGTLWAAVLASTDQPRTM
jgi:6-phosphofructokinase 1